MISLDPKDFKTANEHKWAEECASLCARAAIRYDQIERRRPVKLELLNEAEKLHVEAYMAKHYPDVKFFVEVDDASEDEILV